MSVAELKQTLHKRIEAVEDQEQLEKMLSWMDSTSFADGLSDEEIALLEERNERYQKGEEQEIPIAEFNEKLRRKYGF